MTRRLAALALSVALVLAGCGGGDDDSSSGNVDETEEPVAATNEELVAEIAGVSAEEVTCESEETSEDEAESCTAGTTEYVVGGPGVEVELDSLTARLEGVETASEIADPFGGDPRTPKNGVYVMADLTVANNEFSPQPFSGFADQTQLNAGSTAIQESFNVALNLDDAFAFDDTPIQPDSSRPGVVVYDAPEAVVDQVSEDGNVAIAVVNFVDTGEIQDADQIGLLRIDELAAPES